MLVVLKCEEGERPHDVCGQLQQTGSTMQLVVGVHCKVCEMRFFLESNPVNKYANKNSSCNTEHPCMGCQTYPISLPHDRITKQFSRSVIMMCGDLHLQKVQVYAILRSRCKFLAPTEKYTSVCRSEFSKTCPTRLPTQRTRSFRQETPIWRMSSLRRPLMAVFQAVSFVPCSISGGIWRRRESRFRIMIFRTTV